MMSYNNCSKYYVFYGDISFGPNQQLFLLLFSQLVHKNNYHFIVRVFKILRQAMY